MSTSSPHLKRTPPEQSAPVRSRMAPPRGGPQAGVPPELFTAAGAAVCGAVENGVRTAYSVIDDYMRRGQDAARGIFNNSDRRGFMSDDRGNFGGGYNPMNPLAMVTEQWMMAMRMWSQAFSAFVPSAWQQPGMNPFAWSDTLAPAVSVKVSSASPVEVAVKVNPGLDLSMLVSEPLLAEGFTAPPIDAPAIVREPGTVRVSLKIGAKQPAGKYHGHILKQTDRSVAGDLTVVVS
ncbi:MAG: hypothetical protein ACRD3N_11465 [Terracidiphilus sp.]